MLHRSQNLARALGSLADSRGLDLFEILRGTGAEIGKFYRPKKKPVTMRLDSDVIAWLKTGGRGYQTKANWLLRNAMLHFTKEASSIRRRIAPRHGKPRQGKGKE